MITDRIGLHSVLLPLLTFNKVSRRNKKILSRERELVLAYIVIIGRNFDKNGNLQDWWSSNAAWEFKERSKCLVNQYSKYQVFGKNVSGTVE